MNRDWIQESKIIATELKLLGYEEESRKIIEVIEAGSTGGEILMALRWNFNEILKANPAIKGDLKKRMKNISKEITVTLGMKD